MRARGHMPILGPSRGKPMTWAGVPARFVAPSPFLSVLVGTEESPLMHSGVLETM